MIRFFVTDGVHSLHRIVIRKTDRRAALIACHVDNEVHPIEVVIANIRRLAFITQLVRAVRRELDCHILATLRFAAPCAND